MTKRNTRATPAKQFDELEFSDQMDLALNTANSLVRTVMAAVITDSEHSHLFVTLDRAHDALTSAKELKDGWDAKSRKPRAVETQRLEEAARDAEPSEPMTPGQCDHLQTLVDESRKAHALARRGRQKRKGQKGRAKG